MKCIMRNGRLLLGQGPGVALPLLSVSSVRFVRRAKVPLLSVSSVRFVRRVVIAVVLEPAGVVCVRQNGLGA